MILTVESLLLAKTSGGVWLGVMAFFGFWLLLWLPIALPLGWWLKWRPFYPAHPNQKLPLLGTLYVLAPVVMAIVCHLTHTAFSSYGVTGSTPTVITTLIGFGVGVVGLGLLTLTQVGMGWVTFSPNSFRDNPVAYSPTHWLKPLGIGLGLLILTGWISWTEELIFRGFLVNQFQLVYSAVSTAAIASLIFALLHLVWDGRDTLPQLPGLWLMGVVLVLARWWSGGNLGLPTGLHAGWIWGLACLDTFQILAPSPQGSPWLKGRFGQPLTGILPLLLLLGTTGIVWVIHPWLPIQP